MSEDHMPGNRLVGLNLWRAVLMLSGVLLHASEQLASTPLFIGLELVSEAFRMGAFFAISGYMTAIIMARRGDRWIMSPSSRSARRRSSAWRC